MINSKLGGNKMAIKSRYEDIKHVVSICTHESKNCEHCAIRIGSDDFQGSINHYIEQHGYKLFHVGRETGANVQMTVAVLGV